MKALKISIALSAALAAAPFAAVAQDAGDAFKWDVTAVSDYVFHGVSQTGEDPTLQANASYSWANGFYVGGFASGVDFGPGDPSTQVNAMAGYRTMLGDSVGFDVMLQRYTYPGAGDMNFNELVTTTSFLDNYAFVLAYSNDGGGSDTDVFYYRLTGSWPLPHDFSLNALVGRTDFRENDVVGSRDYIDWGVGVSRRWGMVKASLDFYGTDGDGRWNAGELADNRVVLSIGIGN